MEFIRVVVTQFLTQLLVQFGDKIDRMREKEIKGKAWIHGEKEGR